MRYLRLLPWLLPMYSCSRYSCRQAVLNLVYMILNLVHIYSSTVLLLKKTLCISRSWPTLVLTTALETLGRPLMLKISRENVIWKYLNFPIHFFKFLCDYDLNLCRYLNPELPPMGDFYIGATQFVSADKAQLPLSAETKFHIQKYDGLENIEIRSRTLEVPK